MIILHLPLGTMPHVWGLGEPGVLQAFNGEEVHVWLVGVGRECRPVVGSHFQFAGMVGAYVEWTEVVRYEFMELDEPVPPGWPCHLPT